MIKDRLKGAKRGRVLDQAVEQLRVVIENGEISVGEQLPSVDELGEIMSMSRSSIREALRILETEGLIEIRRGTGTFVKPRDSWYPSRSNVVQLIKERGASLIQLLQIRQSIEGMVAGLAAQFATPELIAELTGLVEQLEDIAKQEADEVNLDFVASLNTSFHFAISRASGNELAHEIILHVLPVFTESNKAILFAGKTLSAQASEHAAVVEAIRTGDTQRAEILMRAHIARVIDEIQEIQDE
jgi:GntR family transcriptional regulator, transcriptional repressor for pyruvate dehydrogenase complex